MSDREAMKLRSANDLEAFYRLTGEGGMDAQAADELLHQHAEIEALKAEIERLREKCDELGSDKERWYRMAELHCSTIDRLKTSMREAMAMLDKHEPEPAGAFAVLLLALNPELQSAKNAALRRDAERLTDEQIDSATSKERDDLLDHIYEYGTAAEGILERIRKLARAAIAKATRGAA